MVWQTEPFRSFYRSKIGTAKASNSYVSYLNTLDHLTGDLDEKIGRVGRSEIVGWLERQPTQSFADAPGRRNCLSALRSYIRFLDIEVLPAPGARPASPVQPAFRHEALEADEDIKSLLREAKRLGARYYRRTGKPLGVTGEVAELEAADKLGLTLLDARSPGFDAFSLRDGKRWRVQIKGRAVDPDARYRGRCPSIKHGGLFDSVMLVLLDRATLDALEIWEAGEAAVIARLGAPGSKARNERNAMGISQFRSIATRIWPAVAAG